MATGALRSEEMRFLLTVSALALLTACSPQDKEKAHRDAQKTSQELRTGLNHAGQEIKKDLRAADRQLHDSMEKGRATAQHAAKELRKEINDGDPDRKAPDEPRRRTRDQDR